MASIAPLSVVQHNFDVLIHVAHAIPPGTPYQPDTLSHYLYPDLFTPEQTFHNRGLHTWSLAIRINRRLKSLIICNYEPPSHQQRLLTALQLTHRSYHHALNELIQTTLPLLQNFLTRVCQGLPADDLAIRPTMQAIQDFHDRTRFFLENSGSRWLSGLFQSYFCADCYSHFHSIGKAYAITRLHQALARELPVLERGLPYPLIVRLFYGFQDPQPLKTFLTLLCTQRIGVSLLTQGLQGICEHAHKFTPLAHAQEPSFGRLLAIMHASCVELLNDKLIDFNVLEQDDPDFIKWRNLREDQTIVLTRFEELQGQRSLFITRFVIGSQVGAKPEGQSDQTIHFAIKSGTEQKIVTDSEVDCEVLLRTCQAEEEPLQNCSDYLLCFSHNRISLGIRQEAYQALENSPFTHCGMEWNMMEYISQEGVGLSERLSHPFFGPDWEKRKSDPYYQRLACQIVANVVQMENTPVPLSPKYIMMGKSARVKESGTLFAKSVKLPLKGKRDLLALENYLHELAGDSEALLDSLLQVSKFNQLPEYRLFRDEALKTFQEVSSYAPFGIAELLFGEDANQKGVKKLQEQMRMAFREACEEIAQLLRQSDLPREMEVKIETIALDIFYRSRRAFQTPPLYRRRIIEKFTESQQP